MRSIVKAAIFSALPEDGACLRFKSDGVGSQKEKRPAGQDERAELGGIDVLAPDNRGHAPRAAGLGIRSPTRPSPYGEERRDGWLGRWHRRWRADCPRRQ